LTYCPAGCLYEIIEKAQIGRIIAMKSGMMGIPPLAAADWLKQTGFDPPVFGLPVLLAGDLPNPPFNSISARMTLFNPHIVMVNEAPSLLSSMETA
jgi:hypothetical protein